MTQSQQQQQQEQEQQLHSIDRSNDSVILADGTTDSAAKREKQEKRRKKRILIVDDEPDITFTFKTVLEENGFKEEVDVYNEPLLALQYFESGIYSLLVTDIAMPKMDGFELYEQVKKIDNKIKVIFVTASEVSYEALGELFLLTNVDLNDDKNIVPILRESEKDQVERFVRKPVEVNKFIGRVKKETFNYR